jgi:hypothetical protein
MNTSCYLHEVIILFPVPCRVSVDSSSVNSVQSSDELAHPSLAALRGGDPRDRKISWSPGSKLIYKEYSIPGYRGTLYAIIIHCILAVA